MPKSIIGGAAVMLVAAIFGVGPLFMSTGPFLNQPAHPGVQRAQTEPARP